MWCVKLCWLATNKRKVVSHFKFLRLVTVENVHGDLSKGKKKLTLKWVHEDVMKQNYTKEY
jgi:hypothetical protein